MDDIIVILGPTGVGKTKLSVELAKKLDAEIINADSVAIYKKLDIGSAKPNVEERQNIPHHLLDICSVTDNYTVYDYQQDARKKIEEISQKGKRVIIVGGTGLYIKSALYDYKFQEGTTTKQYSELSNEEIYNKIKSIKKDIDIHINNRQRLVRMLNKIENNEETVSNKDKCLYNLKVIGLTTNREKLYDIINSRVDKMIKNGLITEIKSLKEYYSRSRVLNSAIGYKEFYDYLFNNKSLEDVVYQIKLNSRHYAKRQYTFFKHQFDVNWFETNYENFNQTVDEVFEFLKNN